jgi:hypothetical protein
MKPKSRALGAAVVVLTAATVAACATTTFQSTWKSPEARPVRFTGQKVLAVFVARNESVRRRAEDAMAREISARGGQGVPSYTLLSQDEVRDAEGARKKVEGQGFAGSVVMRVVSNDTEVRYEPGYALWVGPHYRHFWAGYWGWGWGHVWEPGFVRADKVVRVETLVYSFSQDQLVWAGTSQTVNPDRVEGLVSELATAVSKEMKREGLLERT